MSQNDNVDTNKELLAIIDQLADSIERNEDPDPQIFTLFLERPYLAFQLFNLIDTLDESHVNDNPPIYSACIFGLDVCVAQIQAAAENGNKAANKLLIQVMDHLADLINSNKHSLSFWLPILNAFYEVHVELSPNLKNAYMDLANEEEDSYEETDINAHLNSIKEVIKELSDMSLFDIAENFFAQSYAMPPDFFADLVFDLYSIDEGQDIALLTLLHPKAEVRAIVIATINQIIDNITFSSDSLSRLELIKHWYPQSYLATFNQWIKIQRKKGVVFAPEPKLSKMIIRATEVDGTCAQGTFIQVEREQQHRLCGVLFRYDVGIKDCWITPLIHEAEVDSYYQQALDGSVSIRDVDSDYFKKMAEHFLAISVEHGSVPSVHFLEILELLGLRLKPNKLDLDYLYDSLSVQIVPFTQEVVDESLKRSKTWFKNKKFTESWYLESSLIDKIVNHNSSIEEGVKVCRLYDAIDEVFARELEMHRDKWQFHFLWVALWVKVKARKNEKIWQDSFIIAHCIRDGVPLHEIPLMKEICYQTVLNSVETMQERKTYLS